MTESSHWIIMGGGELIHVKWAGKIAHLNNELLCHVRELDSSPTAIVLKDASVL